MITYFVRIVSSFLHEIILQAGLPFPA